MESILMWDKPKRKMSVKEWKNISADGAPAGVYTPNMSKEDMFKWKAKLIGGKVPRVEIRKTFQKTNKQSYPNNKNVTCQCLMVVSNEDIDGMEDCNVLVSMNGKAGLSAVEAVEFQLAIQEAKLALDKL